MEVPHIIASQRVNYIGKATHRYDETSITELADAGEFVNNYVSVDGRHVPAERARELLTPLLAIPAKKAVAEAKREYSKYWGLCNIPENDEISETQIEAIKFLLNMQPFSIYHMSYDQWIRSSVNYLVTDHGRLTLSEAAKELSVGRTYLLDILSGRRKVSNKISLQQIIGNNLPLRSDHFGVMPGKPYYLPASDPEETDEELFDFLAGFDQAQQLTDGSPRSYENSEACKSMLFSQWEHKTLNQGEEIRGTYIIEEYERPAIAEMGFVSAMASMDFAGAIAALDNKDWTSEAPDDDDDDDDALDVGDIQ